MAAEQKALALLPALPELTPVLHWPMAGPASKTTEQSEPVITPVESVWVEQVGVTFAGPPPALQEFSAGTAAVPYTLQVTGPGWFPTFVVQ